MSHTTASNGTMKTYEVSVSAVYGERDPKRLVRLRHYIENGPASDVKVISEAVLQRNKKIFAVIIVEAADKATVAAAYKMYEDAFAFSIHEAGRVVANAPASRVRYCAYAYRNVTAIVRKVKHPEALLSETTLIASAEMPDEGPYSHIWFIDARSAGKAHKYASYLLPGVHIHVSKAVDMPGFMEQMLAPQAPAPTPPARVAMDDTSSNYTITDVDTVPVTPFFTNPPAGTVNLTDFFAYRNPLEPGDGTYYQLGLNSYYMGWAAASGSTGLWYAQLHEVNRYNQWEFNYNTYATSYNMPVLSGGPVPSSPSATAFSVNVQLQPTPSFVNKVPVGLWLQSLLSPTSPYLQGWPEDSYTGDELAAYNYIIDTYCGSVPTKEGTILPATIAGAIYPVGASYSQTTFIDVQSYLESECGLFQYLATWFGANGYLTALCTQITLVGAIDLDTIANSMEMPLTTGISANLNNTMTMISNAISFVPGIGSEISAVLNIGWAGAQIYMANNGYATTIEGAVSAMGQQLINQMAYYDNGIQYQGSVIASNYGTLYAFAQGCIAKTISEADFGFLDPGPTGPPSAPPANNQSYIDAANNAWMLSIYKMLFAVPGFAPLVKSGISLDTKEPTNDWDPANGNYEYTYWIPGIIDTSSHTNVAGYIIYECESEAPDAVLATLFGPDSTLNVNPVEFFLYLNGWSNPYNNATNGYSPAYYYDDDGNIVSFS